MLICAVNFKWNINLKVIEHGWPPQDDLTKF